ncbi:MAG: pyridoxamine 5'-phosphate oxidase, partial [Nitrosopumilaceae archaeon]|nr:pyridoxamine 5'-phosphate oxidase [Nitrosopumilaceae archaeon]NIX61595.1 pyridoxamine 5'-phosphate oxidase [Nitrosopumilaceae archaeon]
YESRKSRELYENPFASLLFYWPMVHRQVRIQGLVEKISAEDSNQYFRTRPYESQISACASPQSHVIESRQFLERRFSEIRGKYKTKEIPRPANWGGFRVTPMQMEFWQGREHRLHDRILYSRTDWGWEIDR